SRIGPFLAREDSRPFHHYVAFYPPAVLIRNDRAPIERGTVLEPSPLQSEEFPSWMLLHFWADSVKGWGSPQVLPHQLADILHNPKVKAPIDNVTEQREELNRQLAGCCSPATLMKSVKQSYEQQRQLNERMVLVNPLPGNLPPVQTYNNDDQTSQIV